MGLNTYVGIADENGIESWNRKEDTTKEERLMKVMRADLNRHRDAVYYEADLTDRDATCIENLLAAEDWEMALNSLKWAAKELRTKPSHENSWENIPNSTDNAHV